MRFGYAFVIWGFLVALSIYGGYLAATQVVTEDTKTFEFRCSQNFVKELVESPSLNQDLEVSLFNDLTLISFERDETLLALSYIFQGDIPEDFRSSYIEIILYNEEGWAEEFLRSKPKYDFPSGDGHVKILKDFFGNPEVCDVIYKETEYCIFVPLENAVIEKNHFWLRIRFDSIFTFEDNFGEKLKINRAILILNISSDKEEIHENDKTENRSTFFAVFLPIQYDISVVADDHDLKWEHELSSISLGYENVQGALQNFLIIREDTRSYLVAIWALMTSILISFFSIVIGLVNSKEKNSSIRKRNLHDAHIEEFTKEYFKIKEEIKR